MLKPAPDVLTRMLLHQPRVRATTYTMRECVHVCMCVWVLCTCRDAHVRVEGHRGRTYVRTNTLKFRPQPFLAVRRTEF